MSVFVCVKHAPRLSTIKWDTDFDYPKVVDEVVVIHEKSETYPQGVYSLKKSVVPNKVNIKDFINSFADDVGVYNILNKVEMTGDVSLLNLTSGKDLVNDASNLPENEHEAVKAAKKGIRAFENAPSELIRGRTIEQFVETCNEADAKAFIVALSEKLKPSKDGGEDK